MRPKKKGKGYEYEFRVVTRGRLNANASSKISSANILPTGRQGLGARHAHRDRVPKTDEPIRDTRLDALAPPVSIRGSFLVAGFVNRFSAAAFRLAMLRLSEQLELQLPS